MVSPARTGFGNFQLAHSQVATSGIGMSIEASPAATATTSAGGAWRAEPLEVSTESGEKSPETAENRAISESVMVRRRVVHSPPRARSSKEVSSSSIEYSRPVLGIRSRGSSVNLSQFYWKEGKGGPDHGCVRFVGAASGRPPGRPGAVPALARPHARGGAHPGRAERLQGARRHADGRRAGGQLVAGAERRAARGIDPVRSPDGRGRRRDVPGHSRQGGDAAAVRLQPDPQRARRRAQARRGAPALGGDGAASTGGPSGRRACTGS